MRVKRDLMIKLREAKGLTQEDVANKSKLDVRTIQRAEAGTAIGSETLAQIAATLGVPNDHLLADGDEEGEPTPNVGLCVLHAVQTPLQITTLLATHQEADLDCTAETTAKGRAEAVIAFVDAIEKHLPTLMPDVNEPVPTGAEKLRRKVLLEQQLNAALQALKATGLCVFAGTFTDMQLIPHYSFDDGFWVYGSRAQPKPVNTLVIRVSEAGQQRLVVPKKRTEQ